MNRSKGSTIIISLCAVTLVALAVVLAVLLGRNSAPADKPNAVATPTMGIETAETTTPTANPTAPPTVTPENTIKVWLPIETYTGTQDGKSVLSCRRVYDPKENRIEITKYSDGETEREIRIESDDTIMTIPRTGGLQTYIYNYDSLGRLRQWTEEDENRFINDFGEEECYRSYRGKEYEYYDNGNLKNERWHEQSGDSEVFLTMESDYDELGRETESKEYRIDYDEARAVQDRRLTTVYDDQHEDAFACDGFQWYSETKEWRCDYGERLVYEQDGNSRYERRYGDDSEWVTLECYDPEGRVTFSYWETDGSEETVRYTDEEIIDTFISGYDFGEYICRYDKEGRPIQSSGEGILEWCEGADDMGYASFQKTYEYDLSGRLLRIVNRETHPEGSEANDGSGITTFSYDDQGRLIEKRFSDCNGTVTLLYLAKYDDNGCPVSVLKDGVLTTCTYAEVELTESQYETWMKRREDVGDEDIELMKPSDWFFDPYACEYR